MSASPARGSANLALDEGGGFLTWQDDGGLAESVEWLRVDDAS